MSPRDLDSRPDGTDAAPRKAGLPLRIGYYAAVVLAAVFLVMSIVSWSMPLGLCSLVLAVLLFKNIDIVGGMPEQSTPSARTPDK